MKHILCLFHHQQGVTRWLKKRYKEDKDIDTRKPLMKKIFQTRDKRTVRRRLGKLKESSESLGIQEWVEQTESNLPKLLPSDSYYLIDCATITSLGDQMGHFSIDKHICYSSRTIACIMAIVALVPYIVTTHTGMIFITIDQFNQKMFC